jgi:hypothetical protein
MDNKTPRSIIPTQGNMLEELTFRAKLIFRLLGDRRVSPLVKLLPFAGLAYWLLPLPIDNMIPVIDDAALVWLTTYFFIELCPTEVIREHVKELANNNNIVETINHTEPTGEVIDGEATDIQE